MKIEEIKEKATYYETELYSKVRKEQREDQTYIDNTFTVPEVHAPHKVIRHSYGRDMVDAPAEEFITANPQIFVEVTKGTKDAESRFNKCFNNWIEILRRQNPNPFKEGVKNCLARGETFIQLAHNERWLDGEQEGLPVWFLVPEPMNIYASPNENENGMPEEVFVIYERQPKEIILNYPDWSNPKKVGEKDKKKVKYMAYFNRDSRYAEADGEALDGGIKPNLYGLVPFIRRYSGFGKRSPSGELADLIISDIRFARGLLYDECVTVSDIASSLHLFSHKPVIITSEGTINRDKLREEFVLGAYRLIVLDNLPANTKIDIGATINPSMELLNYYERILGQIHERCPLLLAGFPMGTSATQQRVSITEGKRRYLTIIENTETSWATAFEKAFEIIKKLPKLLPPELRKEDLDCEIKCWARFIAPDPVEENRLSLMGSRLFLNKEIDPITNLVEYKGYTKEEARQKMIDTLVWTAIYNTPVIQQAIVQAVAKEAGLLEEIQLAEQASKEATKTLGLTPTPTQTQ